MLWWEESQLRVLVLTSLLIQFLLFFFLLLRRQALPGWFRFIMWLAYHGGDVVAIYALATLFNRHKDQGDCGGRSSNTLLEVVWAPVLLIHLGGQDGVAAYNIEDNELWSRHLLPAVSQVTVAVYVFCKSWPRGGDEKLLESAILLFVVGFVKCVVKAWAFKRASIYSLVSSGAAAKTKRKNDGNMDNRTTLEEYVKDARDIVIRQQPEEDPGTAVMTTSQARALSMEVIKKPALACLRGLSSSKDEAAEGSSNHRRERAEEARKLRQQEKEERGEVSKLFVYLSSSYHRRISIFEKFWGLIIREEERAYESVRRGLASVGVDLHESDPKIGPNPLNTP
ncbi:uncharacterized protein LOC120645539 [Panicum virgatum]|uniref:uncharacterized protein LOC120645539 n=1 Tax=Panicum virgatum TaxID=38727 RepID=UPI0019D5EC2C|nr:uncharacterized protein LOC120645539 [Panicum virgatum]